MPRKGERRFLSTSTARARSGERYTTRVRASVGAPPPGRATLAGGGSDMRRVMHQRHAVRVLPEPVGARISVSPPAAMAGQPLVCGGVGAGKDVANHSATGAENRSSSGSLTATTLRTGYDIEAGPVGTLGIALDLGLS